MKTDKNGCSTCGKGEEEYEYYQSPFGERIQYDYRRENGQLFSCIAKNLDEARRKKDDWLLMKKSE